MDKLSPEVIGLIFQYLPIHDLLNCRLTCNLFKCEVDHQLASITHAKINEDGLDQTFIANIFYPCLVALNFYCKPKNFDSLFTFLQRKCPNLCVLSAVKETIALEQLLKVSKKLVYFEVDHLCSLNHKNPKELRSLFPYLQAIEIISGPVPYPFCINAWSEGSEDPNNKLPKLIKSSNICCNLAAHKVHLNKPITRGISWYFAHESFAYSMARQLSDPSIVNSLRVLQVTIKHIAYNFNLPNLLYAHICFDQCDSSKILHSLKYSKYLQIIDLRFIQSSMEIHELSSLLSVLEQLTSLSLFNDNNQCIEVPLGPRLIRLAIEGFAQINFTQSYSDSLKFIKFGEYISSITGFNFPNLIECQVTFKYASSSLIEKVFNSLEDSVNLKKLNISIIFMDSPLTQVNQVYSSLERLKKLESIEFLTYDEVPKFNLKLSNYPHLRYLKWESDESGKLDIYFDDKYDSVIYESECRFTVRPLYGHSIKVDFPLTTNIHFKHGLESSVTKAAFVVPFKSPSFYLPHLLECKISLSKNEDKIFQTLITSLSHSMKLQSFTLVAEPEAKLTLAQMKLLLRSLARLNNLQKLDVSVHVSSHNSLEVFKFELSKPFNYMDRNWHIFFFWH